MDNQHQKITGYRDLSQAEIDLMNAIKAKESEVAELYRQVQQVHVAQADAGEKINDASRQASIARTEFEHAFMRLVRSVARPASPWIR